MTKSNKPRVSIRVKIWLAMMGITVAVIAAVWVLQIVFLEDFYETMRKDSLLDNAKRVIASIDENGFWKSKDLMSKIASENSLCIDISDAQGMEMMYADGLGDNCLIHMNPRNRIEVLKDAVLNQGDFRVISIKHPQFDTRYITCATTGVTVTEDATPYIIVLTASLAPVREASAAIKGQLLYISILLIVVAVAVSFLVTRSLTGPLVKISKAARQIADGSLNVLVDVKSKDEIGDLAEDFNTMSREISKVNTLQRELVANISHDIRTPLTMIRGYAEMIKDITGDDKEAREQQLDIIVDETKRLSTLVSDVMDLSLMQAGQTAFHPADFDLTSKVRDILSRFQLLEHTSGFEFLLESQRPYVVYADDVRIEQVLYNLINNAVNHIGEIKRITVRLLPESSAENDTEQPDLVRVEVIDTGTGISQEDLPLIWDRYYKPYKKGEKKGMGTGLGLSIVKAILVNHQSLFGVNSTLGVGSTFWFTLQLAAETLLVLSEKNE